MGDGDAKEVIGHELALHGEGKEKESQLELVTHGLLQVWSKRWRGDLLKRHGTGAGESRCMGKEQVLRGFAGEEKKKANSCWAFRCWA